MTDQLSKAERKLKGKIANAFKIAREEGVLHRFADGLDDTDEVMTWVREAGYKSPEEIALMFNPDYLKFQNGVQAGRELERGSMIEAGYRLPAGKAPLLTEKERASYLNLEQESIYRGTNSSVSTIDFQSALIAQRDADHKFYGGKE